jgi:hypothetical protein
LAASARRTKDVPFEKINPVTSPWTEAELRARACSAGWGIPFVTFDPVLTDAKQTMRELVQVAAGNETVPFSALDSRYALLEERLQELANSVPELVRDATLLPAEGKLPPPDPADVPLDRSTIAADLSDSLSRFFLALQRLLTAARGYLGTQKTESELSELRSIFAEVQLTAPQGVTTPPFRREIWPLDSVEYGQASDDDGKTWRSWPAYRRLQQGDWMACLNWIAELEGIADAVCRQIAHSRRHAGARQPGTDQAIVNVAPTTKRSTDRGEGRKKLIAALTKHLQYADGGCLNLEPIGNNELAKAAEVSPSTASTFFNDNFQGHAKYKAMCRDTSNLAAALKLLNDEFAPYHLLGAGSPDVAAPDEEDADGE